MPRPLVRSRKRKKASLLPQSLQESVMRFIRMAAGGGVIIIALAIAITLFSYDPHDPSWNAATAPDTPAIHNLCGIFGAYAADMMWQFFGLGAFALPVVVAAWGWRVASGQELEMLGWRLVAAVGSMVMASTALGALHPALGWMHPPRDGALGQIIGGALVGILPFPWGVVLFAPFFALAAVLALYLACALSIEEWQFVGQTLHRIIAWIAGMAHRLGASLWRLLHREHSALDDDNDPDDEQEEDADDEEIEEEEEEPPHETPTAQKPARVKPPLVKRPAATARQAKLALRPDSDDMLPPLELLQWPDNARQQTVISEDALEKNAKLLETVLQDFGVNGQILKVSPGPVVTLYELEPSPGTRAARVISLADDIARNMSAASVRVAVVPGRNVIGIELPNAKRETVYLRELLTTDMYNDSKAVLPLVLGKDIAGGSVIADLAKMPHLLIAGTTGSGKSVAINTMILSLLYRLPPQKCRFIMIDPKMLELSVYEGIPHLLAPVVTEPKKAIMALRWTVREMEERYRAMSKLGVRNIDGYNMRLREASKQGENLMRTVQTGFDRETGKPIYEEQPLDLTELPYIVVIVDEMADLMMVAGKEIEAAIQRLAQMARAAGIHIMMATQRPSVDVITGTIKANFPTRISFQVTSKIDSRTILGEQGAEQLLGQGDMLYMAGGGRITRVHGPFVRDDEVEKIVKFLKAQGEPEYLDEVTEDDGSGSGDGGGASLFGGGEGSGDDLYDKAVDIVLRERKASTSFIQRQLQIGYNKAANLVERMERENLIGPANATGKREIYGRDTRDDA
ncbi:MAG: DNA translocase FtsK 4TM domain-containing protein [Alphaproteobacteria bacterium]|nr:DNA translocase FtsK 4TM domain-containing protein [Alphaproteobacteria bacterium]